MDNASLAAFFTALISIVTVGGLVMGIAAFVALAKSE
ncbi:hypothetical protein EDF38_0588 [Frigoribacterium sp. PhB160]|nr:hypothetical protein EDF38_0588 [Frigoribacterium sp. PhB160]